MVDFENWQDQIENRLEYAVKIGKDMGIEEYEIFMTRLTRVNVELLNGLINAKNGGQIGVGIRVVNDKRIGFSASSGLEKNSIQFAFENAQAVAKNIGQKDEKWEGFHSVKGKGEDGIIDNGIVNYDPEVVVNQVNEVITETKAVDDRIFSVGGSFSATYGVGGVANSEDLLKSTKLTSVSGGFQIQAKEGDKIKSDEVPVLRRTVPETLSGLTIPTTEKIIKMLDSKPFGGSEQLPVVFDNSSATQMMGRSLGNAINGESVINNRSRFADKIGADVATSEVTIYDDGQARNSPRTTSIDTEGVTKQTNTIIEDGVLLSYIFDTYHANIYEVEPTGNAQRSNYENGPNIGINAIRMKPGLKTRDQIISEIDRGVLLTGGFMGLHTTNVISGDFSVVNQQAFMIENGEISHALEAITIGGNHYDFFKNIRQIGNEQEIKPGFFSPPSIVPSLEVSGISISG